MVEKTQVKDAAGGIDDVLVDGKGVPAAVDEAPMPRNIVGGGVAAGAGGGGAADGAGRLPQLSEAAWRAQNMPATRLLVRWGYRNGQVQLLNRRMRNLAERRVGPAMCAWIRERVEWEAANRLRERRCGVIVVDVDPADEGSVDVRVDALGELPVFTRDMLDGNVPAGLHPWVVTADGRVRRLHVDAIGGAWGEGGDAGAAGRDALDAVVDDGAESAIDRFALDLAKTLGFAVEEADEGDAADTLAGDAADTPAGDAADTPADDAVDVAGYFATSEEWGIVACAGDEELDVVRKLAACFDTLWSGTKGV